MKNIELDFPQRMGLANFLSGVTGSLGKMVALGRVLDNVRLSEGETAECKVQNLGNGSMQIEPPKPGWGSVTASVEDGDADVLMAEIDTYQHFRPADLSWVLSVKSQIENSNNKKGKSK